MLLKIQKHNFYSCFSFLASNNLVKMTERMPSITTDQVSIDVEQLNGAYNANKPNESLIVGTIAVDGRRSGHRRHGSNGSHHQSHQSGESDTEDKHRSRRSRRRSRSRSRSPSHRAKRATDSGVSQIILPK